MDNLSAGSGDQRVSGQPPVVDIVIVNWNAGDQLRECLQSIAEHGGDVVASVIVVDNGSVDESLNHIKRFNLPLIVIRNDENRGFAAACNQGVGKANSEFILFLNPDARLMRGTLNEALEFFQRESAKKIGIVGVRLLDEQGRTQRHCARFPSWSTYLVNALGLGEILPSIFQTHIMADFDHITSKEVSHVIGAFFLVRRTVFDALSGFDERFFVYLEDLDFSLRARKAGWITWYLADAVAFHKGGGTSEQVKAYRLFYSLRSRLLYAFKHFRWWEAWAVFLLTVLLEPWSRFVRATMRRSFAEISDTARGYRMLWADLPQIMKMALNRDDKF